MEEFNDIENLCQLDENQVVTVSFNTVFLDRLYSFAAIKILVRIGTID